MSAYGFVTMSKLTPSIATDGADGTTFAVLKEGIENIAEALNEVVQQYFFLSDDGFAKNHVTGMAPVFTLTGKRVQGDAAQEYIFAAKYGMDTERQSKFKLEYSDAEGKTVTLTCACTICNVQEWSGATTDDSSISFEIRLDGKPEIATAA